MHCNSVRSPLPLAAQAPPKSMPSKARQGSQVASSSGQSQRGRRAAQQACGKKLRPPRSRKSLCSPARESLRGRGPALESLCGPARRESPCAPARRESPCAPLRVGTDFSGIDSPLWALDNAGIKYDHVFSCESDSKLRTILQLAHNPQILCPNVKTRDNNTAPPVDLFVLGPPCQSFSSAGKNRGIADPKGWLVWYSLDYIRHQRPAAVLVENVSNLATKHKEFFCFIMSELRRMGYSVTWALLNTNQHGLPQNRPRVYVAGVRKDKLQRPFSFPPPLAKCMPVMECLGIKQMGATTQALPAAAGARDNVLWGLERAIGKGVDPFHTPVVIDTCASPRFRTCQTEMSPCVTASRAQVCGYWLSTHARLVTLGELAKLQGMDLRRFGDYESVGINGRCIGHAIGNAMSVSVLERILIRLVWAAGLVDCMPRDLWEERFGVAAAPPVKRKAAGI